MSFYVSKPALCLEQSNVLGWGWTPRRQGQWLPRQFPSSNTNRCYTSIIVCSEDMILHLGSRVVLVRLTPSKSLMLPGKRQGDPFSYLRGLIFSHTTALKFGLKGKWGNMFYMFYFNIQNVLSMPKQIIFSFCVSEKFLLFT